LQGAFAAGQTLSVDGTLAYNSYLTTAATKISSFGSVAEIDPVKSSFVMEGAWIGASSSDVSGLAGSVYSVDRSVAGQLTFWVMGFENNTTKGIQVQLNDVVGGGITAKVLQAEAAQDQGDLRSASYHFENTDRNLAIATSDSQDGLGVRSSSFNAWPTLSDADGLGTYHYQWLADGEAIAGANSRSHTLTSNEASKQVGLMLSYVDGKGTLERVSTVPLSLLDLAASTDTTGGSAGTAMDNITTSHVLTLNGLLQPNQVATLYDGSTQIGTATADGNGLASWNLSSVASGSHHYTLTSPDTIQLVGVSSALDVTVL